MKNLSRWIAIPLLASAAIFFYSIGNVSSLIVFLIMGFIFELIFWIKLISGKKNKQTRSIIKQ